MKKMTKLIFAVVISATALLICCAYPAFALTDGDWEFQLLDNEAVITGYKGSDSEIVIPDTIYGVPVTEIKNGIFNRITTTKISFPKTVKKIGRVIDAHEYTDLDVNLEEVYIPEGVEVIGANAFSSYDKLKSVKLPSTVTEIGIEAFYKCASLEEINLPEGLKTIGLEAFSGCNLKSVETPSTLTELKGGAFSRNPKLESVKINAGIVNIRNGRYYGMFQDCTSLKNVDLPNTLTSISGAAFAGCTSLESIILPVSLKSIVYGVFAGCTGLTEMIIPAGVEELGSAFENCTNLKSLYIPDSVTSLSGNVIKNCNDCIIFCTAESTAAKVCKENQISFLTDKSVNSGITVLYNGTRVSFHAYDQNPEIVDSRTLVPLRAIFESMDAEVTWDQATQTATAVRGGITVSIAIGSNTLYKNGKAIEVDVPAQLINSRTMVPARVIAESFGANVQWNGNGYTVLITE